MDWIDRLVFEGPVEGLQDDPSDASGLTAELRREIGPGHELYRKAWVVIGRAIPQDDVFVRTDDGLWGVHVTWKGRRERAGYPSTQRFESAAEFERYVAQYGWVRGEDY